MKLFTIVFLLLPIAGFQASASSADDVITCKGTVQNLDRDYLKEVDMLPQSYDAQYFEGKIEGYTFGALSHDFAIGQAIMLVADPAAKRTAMLNASLTRVPGTNVKYATQQYVIDEDDGTQTWITAACYLAPPGEANEVNALQGKQAKVSALLKRRQ